MAVSVKICGLNTLDSINAAVAGGADFIGIVFYPHSPRYVALNEAARLVRDVPPEITKVGLFVDATDVTISATLGAVDLDMLQLHGSETPERIAYLHVPRIFLCIELNHPPLHRSRQGHKLLPVRLASLCNAQAVLANSCALNLFVRRSAELASVTTKLSADWPTVATAHAVLTGL